MEWLLPGVLFVPTALAALAAWQMRRRSMHRWLPAYLRQAASRRGPRPGEDVHVLICFADHYEPKANRADRDHGRRRVAAWTDAFPRQFGRFKDSDGRPPRYTFFFPIEEYEPEYLDALA